MEQSRGGGTKRQHWEQRYLTSELSEMAWYRSEPPAQLESLLADGAAKVSGGALDLGCGPGVVTVRLAQTPHLHPVVGVDIAHSATVIARNLVSEGGHRASFVVAEAPVIPFRDRSFGLVVDRGCLQAIPLRSWGTYFREVERVLEPGGYLQLYLSRVAGGGGRRGARRLVRRLRRGIAPRPALTTSEAVRRHLPGALEVLTLDDALETFQASKSRRTFTYGLFRRV